MAERRVLKMGDPRLERVSEPVRAFAGEALERLVADLWDTMAARGGVGIAAPQIGVPERVVVFGMEQHPRRRELPPIPWTVLANPEIEPLDDTLEAGWEGCLSVPGLRGFVPRHPRVRYRGLDAEGNPIEREVEGFHARVVQHECDHLDGILYPRRIADLRHFGFEEELSLAGRLTTPDC